MSCQNQSKLPQGEAEVYSGQSMMCCAEHILFNLGISEDPLQEHVVVGFSDVLWERNELYFSYIIRNSEGGSPGQLQDLQDVMRPHLLCSLLCLS